MNSNIPKEIVQNQSSKAYVPFEDIESPKIFKNNLVSKNPSQDKNEADYERFFSRKKRI